MIELVFLVTKLNKFPLAGDFAETSSIRDGDYLNILDNKIVNFAVKGFVNTFRKNCREREREREGYEGERISLFYTHQLAS